MKVLVLSFFKIVVVGAFSFFGSTFSKSAIFTVVRVVLFGFSMVTIGIVSGGSEGSLPFSTLIFFLIPLPEDSIGEVEWRLLR